MVQPLDMDSNRVVLTTCLAKLYESAGDKRKTLSLLLDLRSEVAFSFIEENGFFQVRVSPFVFVGGSPSLCVSSSPLVLASPHVNAPTDLGSWWRTDSWTW